MLSPGQANDLTCAEPLVENFDPAALIGDKAYDADPFVKALADMANHPGHSFPPTPRDSAAV
jgi:hypothetical protein